MINLKGIINKISTSVSKDGDIIATLVIKHNLTGSGDLSTMGELTAIQGLGVECSIEADQDTLSFKPRKDRVEVEEE